TRGPFGVRKVNVRAQQRDPVSFLRWFENLIRTLHEAPEIGTGCCTVIDVAMPRGVLVHRMDAASGSVILLHNLTDETATIDVGPLAGVTEAPYDLLVD